MTPDDAQPQPASASTTSLLVLRHGQSEWNAQGRWQGHADIALDALGVLQADEAAAVIAQIGTFTAVWSSDLRRARATAEAIASSVGCGPVRVDARLRENDVGPWEGLTQREVEQGWPGYLAARRRPEGFESYDSAASRMLGALVDIARVHEGASVVAVSHGGIIRATRRALGAADLHLPNLGGSWFTVDPRGGVAAGQVVMLHDAGERTSRVPTSPAPTPAAPTWQVL